MHKWVNDPTCVNLLVLYRTTPHRASCGVVPFLISIFKMSLWGRSQTKHPFTGVSLLKWNGVHCFWHCTINTLQQIHANKYNNNQKENGTNILQSQKKTIKNEQRTQKLMNTKMWSIFRQWITQCHFTRSQLIYNIVNNIVIKFIVWPARSFACTVLYSIRIILTLKATHN